jgi:hypothetical protein
MTHAITTTTTSSSDEEPFMSITPEQHLAEVVSRSTGRREDDFVLEPEASRS